MTMIIAQFDVQQDAQDKIDLYSEWAKAPGVEIAPPISPIYKHATLDIWFFCATACIQNGGLGRSLIEADVETLTDTFTIEAYSDLYGLGYWSIDN